MGDKGKKDKDNQTEVKETGTNNKKDFGETTDKNPCIETIGERCTPQPFLLVQT